MDDVVTDCPCDCEACSGPVGCMKCSDSTCDSPDCKNCAVQNSPGRKIVTTKRAVPKRMGVQFRSAAIDPTKISVDARSVDVAFSSEAPVERFYGREVLDHNPKSVRMTRMNNGAAVLFNHNPDQHIGVVDSASIGADRIGRATVRFGNSAFAQEKFKDVQDGILRGISVGYLVNRMALDSEDAEGDTYRVNDWEPVEITFTPLPADPSVGVGRSAAGAQEYPVLVDRKIPAEPVKEQHMSTAAVTAPAVDTVERARVMKEAGELETARVRNISMISAQFAKNVTADDQAKWIQDGTAEGEVRKLILERIVAAQQKQTVRTAPTVDLTDKEAKKFSLMRLIQHIVSRSEGANGPDASFELEVVAAAEKRHPAQRGGIVIPMDLKFGEEVETRAGLVQNTNSAGGFSVQTTLQSLIELLRNRMVVRQAGATVMSGLTDTIAFPKQLTPGTANWVAENPGSDNVDADLTLGQITMSPKMLTSSTSYSRKLLAQSSLDIEALVRNDLVAISAIALDLAALNGLGSSNQPTGILQTAGINLIAHGANGVAPTYADFVAMETLIAGQNADIGAMAYVVTPEVRGFAKRTVKVSGQIMGTIFEQDGSVNGYRAYVTNQLPKLLTLGTATDCHAGIFGVWSGLMIGEWGSIELIVDPYRLKKQGMIEIASYLMADIAVRYPVEFSVSKYWSAATL
jgi:HK97 family phage major capsid protein